MDGWLRLFFGQAQPSLPRDVSRRGRQDSGPPHAISAQGDVEFLTYNLLNKGVGDMKEFVVRIQKGSVESFGERSNFGSSLFGTNAPAGATAK